MSSVEELEVRLEQAVRERDQALTECARVRAELDALRLALQRRGEPEPPLYPDSAAPGLAPPLRYVVADSLNDAVKGVLGPLHRFVRARWGHER
jgi:hypothetical protein